MQVTALVSEGGNHSPEQWAHVTTLAIIQIDPQIEHSRQQTAEALVSSIEGVLAAFYRTLLGKEAEALQMFHDRCDTPLQVAVEGLAEDALTVIQDVATGTPWESKLKEAEWALLAFTTIISHFATAAHVERLWFADRNPKNAAAAAYKLKHNG